MSLIDYPFGAVTSALDSFFGWTFAFVIALHGGAYLGACLRADMLLPPELLLGAILVITVYAVFKQNWTLVIPPLIILAWWLPMYTDSVGKRVIVLLATFTGAAIIACV